LIAPDASGDEFDNGRDDGSATTAVASTRHEQFGNRLGKTNG
jgi:hypothetical protein